jgi:hypothetical protein
MCIDRGRPGYVVPRLGLAVAAAHRLPGLAVLQELDHEVVELDEADVEPLCSTLSRSGTPIVRGSTLSSCAMLS